MLSRDSVHLSELQRDPNKYVKYKFKKNSLSITRNREVKQFYVIPINDDEFSLSQSPSTLNVGCLWLLVFRYIHSNGRYGSARVGVSGPKLESNAMLAGGHWRGYPIPQYRKKHWQIPKYRVKNRRNTDTAFIFGHVYLKLYTSRVFVYLKHLCTSNQPQPLRGNVRRPRIDR